MKSGIKTGLVFVGGSIATLIINDVYPLAKAYILNKTIPSLSSLNPLWIVEIVAFCSMGFGMFLILKEKYVSTKLKNIKQKSILETNILGYPKTNYLTESDFKQFLWGLVRLEAFINPTEKPPMSAQRFVNLFTLMRECDLTISEAINLRKGDFDLGHKIIMIRYPNSDKVEKTITLPKDDIWLQKYLLNYNDDDKIFQTSSETVHQYAEDAGRLGGLGNLS